MKCLFVLSIIAMIFVTGEAIKCYEGLLFDESFDGSKASSRYCTSLSNACELQTMKFTNGSIISTRSCTLSPSIPMTNMRANLPMSTNLYLESICQHLCYTDLCNSAQSLTSSFVITLSAITSFSFAFKHLYWN